MKNIAAIVFLLLAPVVSQAQLFGLGDEPVSVLVVNSVEDTFGLAKASVQKVSTKAVAVVKRSIETVTTPPVLVIRRASGNWTDRSIGPWNIRNLRLHLLGELGDAIHRGTVTRSVIEAATFNDLVNIHDNLHEGWIWDGSARRVVTKTVAVQPSNCPGGVCPAPTNYTMKSSRRIFRR